MRLKREREAAKLTQTELAKLSRVSQSSISKIERGVLLMPSFDTLDRLTRALQRCGRRVDIRQLQPRPQLRLWRHQRKGAA